MTNLGSYSKSEVAEATTVALATIGTMRKKLALITADQKRLAAEAHEWDPVREPEPRDMTWEEAKARGKDRSPRDEEWEEKLAQKWAEQLVKAFGAKWGKMPLVAARAIDLYSEGLSKHLIEYWGEEAREFVAAMGDDLDLLSIP